MSEQSARFPSLRALQDANDRLLDVLDAADQTPDESFWDEVMAFIGRAEATGAILDITNERRAAQSILDYWDNALYRADRPAPGARLTDFNINLAPDLKDQPCPYRGLAAFDENSAEFFFGRRMLIGQMVAKVRDGARLMVVVGPSGSGKSSVVRAGLLRELKRNDAIAGSEGWRYVSMVPGAEPVANLDRALAQAAPAPDQRIVLVVDQFEEVFTVCEDSQARLAFEARLVELLKTPAPEHIVILTLREDFVDNLSQLIQLYNRYREPGTRVNVEAMDINELREVIEGPAAMVGLRFEEGVVDDLASKVLGERAGLPLLQFTLLQLWEKRRRNRVTMDVYTEVGSPLEALKRSADDFYERLLPEDKTRARNILLAMVDPGEGKEFTSNRVPLENAFGADQAPERVELVVYRLICEARLVKLTGTTQDICADEFAYHEGKLRALIAEEAARGNTLQIEVAHEALVRNWPKLETWLNEERQNLQARWDFRRQAERWEQSGEKSEWLARGATLKAAEGYPTLSDLEQRFRKAGRRAELLDRAARVAGLAAILIGAFLAVAMLWQVERVRRQQVGISRTAALALIANDKEIEERLGWALKAYVDQQNLDDDPIAEVLEGLHLLSNSSSEAEAAEGLSVEAALRGALKDAPVAVLHRFWNDASPIEVQEIIASPDGRRLATLSLSNDSLGLVAALWDWETRQQQTELRPKVVAPTIGESGLLFNDAGSVAAGIGETGAIYLWDTGDGTVLRELTPEAAAMRIWLGPAGSNRLAAATSDQRLHLWDTASGRQLWEIASTVWPPHLAFSADGLRIATVVEQDTLCLLPTSEVGKGETPDCASIALPPDSYLSDLIGCREGNCFYAALESLEPQVCDDSGCRPMIDAPVAKRSLHFASQPFCERVETYRNTTDDVSPISTDEEPPGNTLEAPSAAGENRVILTAYDDESVQLWDVTDPVNPVLSGPPIKRTSLQVALMRQDCAVVGTIEDTGGALFDVTSGTLLAQTTIESSDAGTLYNIGDGIGIASADKDDAIRLWGFARTGEAEPLWRGGDLDARSISPDGRWGATKIGNKVNLINLANRESTPILFGSAQQDADLPDTAIGLLLGAEGRLLLWQAFDDSARLTDTESGAELARFNEAPALQAFALAKNLLAVAGADGVLRMWDITDPAGLDVTQPITFSLPITDVRAAALSLDGKWLAIARKGQVDQVSLWDVEKRSAGRAPPAVADAQAVALNGDGTRLAVMHENPESSILPTRVTIWDTVSGQKIAEMSVSQALPSLAFSAGATDTEPESLIVAHGNGEITTIYRHFITTRELAHRAAQIAGCRLEADTAPDTARFKPECTAMLLAQPRRRLSSNIE